MVHCSYLIPSRGAILLADCHFPLLTKIKRKILNKMSTHTVKTGAHPHCETSSQRLFKKNRLSQYASSPANGAYCKEELVVSSI